LTMAENSIEVSSAPEQTSEVGTTTLTPPNTPPPPPPSPPANDETNEVDVDDKTPKSNDTSKAAALEDNEEESDELAPLPLPFMTTSEMMRQSEVDSLPAEERDSTSGGLLGGFMRQRRRSSIPVIATAQGAGTTLDGKTHGTCLSRISMRSVFMKDWKSCLWVFENGKQLYVFKDADAYKMYHENVYLDEETKKFLLKGYFVLGVNHHCKPITHKEFGGEMIHGFSLEKITDFGSQTQAKFGHKDSTLITELWQILHQAISDLIAIRVAKEEEENAPNLDAIYK